MNDTTKITQENGNNKVKIEIDKYSDRLLISTDGWQYNGATINKEVAEITIRVLREYIKLETKEVK